MKKLDQIIGERIHKDRPTNLHQEFQVYGVFLAESLADTKHYSLYIKLAKTVKRELLEQALSFVKGSHNAKSKGKLFMWKLKILRSEASTQDLAKSNS